MNDMQRIIDHEPERDQARQSKERFARDLAVMIKRELELWPESFSVTRGGYTSRSDNALLSVELSQSGVAIISQYLKDNL